MVFQLPTFKHSFLKSIVRLIGWNSLISYELGSFIQNIGTSYRLPASSKKNWIEPLS